MGLCLAPATCTAAESEAQESGVRRDVVVVRSSNERGKLRRRGEIVDYTGEALTLRLPSGREQQIDPRRVLDYETERTEDQLRGDQLFGEGRYAEAVVSYMRAARTEKRKWMRRELLAKMARCYANIAQFKRAGDVFVLLVRSDPTTYLLDAIPLCWLPRQPKSDVVERAKQWMERSDAAAARLLGASWLLTTSDAAEAQRVLQQLTTASDRRIALLAEMQLWRDEVVLVSSERLEVWKEQIELLEPELRAGGYWLVGRALTRHNQNQEAALMLLRIPILFPMHRELAGEALFLAGEQLEKAGERAAAHRVFRELVENHPDHRLAPVAKQKRGRAAPD